MGSVLGFVGDIAGAAISANATENAVRMQQQALQQQRDFVFSQLSPETINAQATNADVQQILSQLALQNEIDPSLSKVREVAQKKLLEQTQNLGAQSGQVADAATAEALAPNSVAQNKQALIDAALKQLKLGASLPPDVQAELVQSGLEQSGMVTQGASGQGVGGQLLRTILGSAGVNLQMQRQQQASQLLASAQNLETSRANILQGLFPNLTQNQLSNMAGAASAFQTANGAAPNVGLNGTNIANIWLARVGATNQLTQSAANIGAQGAMAQGNIWGQALGGATRAASPLANQLWSSINPQYTGSAAPGTLSASDLTPRYENPETGEGII